MIRGEIQCSQCLQSSTGNVTCAGIDHGIMVGKRNLSKKLPIAAAIKGGPATVLVLHAQNPTKRTIHSLSFSAFIVFLREANFGEGGEYLKRIVHVRIK